MSAESSAADASARSYGGRTLAARRAERRERFREAGLELFGTLGFSRVTISGLCAEAGLSRRQFYEEYSSSEALLTEIYENIQREAMDSVTAATMTAAASGDIRTIARAAIVAYLDVMAADPRSVRCAFIEIAGISEEMEDRRIAGRVRWAKYINDLSAALTNTAPDPLDYRATAFIGALASVVHRWATSSPRPDRDVIVELLTDMLEQVPQYASA